MEWCSFCNRVVAGPTPVLGSTHHIALGSESTGRPSKSAVLGLTPSEGTNIIEKGFDSMTINIAQRAVISADTPTINLSTAILDINLQFMKFVPWQRATTMLVKGSVNVIQPYFRQLEDGFREQVMIKTPSCQMPLPFIVTLSRFVYDPYAGYLRSNSPIATKRAILTRDSFTCAYQFHRGRIDKWGNVDGCTGKGTTVDHIIPQSRKGPNTWENMAAACSWCNNHKADRTPEEAGMTLLFTPESYDGGRSDINAEIHEFLMQESGAYV